MLSTGSLPSAAVPGPTPPDIHIHFRVLNNPQLGISGFRCVLLQQAAGRGVVGSCSKWRCCRETLLAKRGAQTGERHSSGIAWLAAGQQPGLAASLHAAKCPEWHTDRCAGRVQANLVLPCTGSGSPADLQAARGRSCSSFRRPPLPPSAVAHCMAARERDTERAGVSTAGGLMHQRRHTQ